jgi:hypothetical protein
MLRITVSCMLLLQLPGIQAQTVTGGSWGSVQLLDPGQKVQVQRFGTERVSGRFLSATVDSVVVRHRSAEVTIPRTEVQEFKARRASRRLRNGGIGAAVGGGVAGGVTALALSRDFDTLAAGITLVLAAMGAGVGFVIGMSPPAYGTVYKATR